MSQDLVFGFAMFGLQGFRILGCKGVRQLRVSTLDVLVPIPEVPRPLKEPSAPRTHEETL